MTKRILMIIAPSDYRDEELDIPKALFQENGYHVTIASNGVKKASGMLGGTTEVDLNLNEINVSDFDAVVFVGGPGSSIYFNNATAHKIAFEAYKSKKILGAICIAPSILANAGVLTGKQATSFPSETSNLKQKNVNYTGNDVTIAGNIVTASGPEAAKKFGETILSLLEKQQNLS